MKKTKSEVLGERRYWKKNGTRRIGKIKNEKNADEKRYINERREKLWEFDDFFVGRRL